MKTSANRMTATLVCRLLQCIAPKHLKTWIFAIQHELDEIDDDREALGFAAHSFFGLAPRIAALRLFQPFAVASGCSELVQRGIVDQTMFDELGKRPRAIGVACAVGAVGLGMIFMLMAGAPARYLAVNASALAIGLLLLCAANPSTGKVRFPSGLWTLAMAGLLLATAMFGTQASGAARWIAVSGLHIQTSFIVLPGMLIALSVNRGILSAIGIAVAAVAIAMQPDRAMAGILFAGVAAIAAFVRERRIYLVLAISAAALASTLLRPVNIPAAAFVDQIVGFAFSVHIAAGLAVMLGLSLLIVPAVLGWRSDAEHRHVYAVFGAVWAAAVLAAALGNYPTPAVGYSGAAVLGYVLSLSMLPRQSKSSVDSQASKGHRKPVESDHRNPWSTSRLRRGLAVSMAFVALASCSSPAEKTETAKTQAWPPVGHQQVAIWPKGAPDMEGIKQPAESIEVSVYPNRFAGLPITGVENVSTPTMTIYPPKGANSGAAIVVFPGGGFEDLAIDLEGTEVCDWLTGKGITCILSKYRVPGTDDQYDGDCACHITPKVRRALQDAQRTIRLVRSQARSLGVDPNKIGVIGFSAGGYLVVETSNKFEPAYQSVDAVDRISSRPDFAIAVYPGHIWREPGWNMDPSLKVTKQTPQTFILQAWDDEVDGIQQSLIYARALETAGVSAEVHLFARGGHAFGLRPTGHPVDRWPTLVEDWLGEIGVLHMQRR